MRLLPVPPFFAFSQRSRTAYRQGRSLCQGGWAYRKILRMGLLLKISVRSRTAAFFFPKHARARSLQRTVAAAPRTCSHQMALLSALRAAWLTSTQVHRSALPSSRRLRTSRVGTSKSQLSPRSRAHATSHMVVLHSTTLFHFDRTTYPLLGASTSDGNIPHLWTRLHQNRLFLQPLSLDLAPVRLRTQDRSLRHSVT
jgi:hypothetical protein